MMDPISSIVLGVIALAVYCFIGYWVMKLWGWVMPRRPSWWWDWLLPDGSSWTLYPTPLDAVVIALVKVLADLIWPLLLLIIGIWHFVHGFFRVIGKIIPKFKPDWTD